MISFTFIEYLHLFQNLLNLNEQEHLRYIPNKDLQNTCLASFISCAV